MFRFIMFPLFAVVDAAGDTLIPPDPAPVREVDDDAPRRTRQIVCEFCECKLTPAGEIVKMGQPAKKYRDQRQALEDAERSIAALENELERTKRELSAALAAATPPSDQSARRRLLTWEDEE